MKLWEKPEIINLDFQKTMQDGTPHDAIDSTYLNDDKIWQCDFGKKTS